MKCIVTGGAGFIGSHLTDHLITEGIEVAVVDDLSSGSNKPDKNFIQKDIRSDLSTEFQGADTVFHLAADPDIRSNTHDPQKRFDVNVSGTLSVLESCRKADVPCFVLASTSAVYGETDQIPTPEDVPCSPISHYGAGKMACESYASCYSALYGMKCTSLRMANIFGERSIRGVMHDLYQKLKKNPNQLEILGDGKQDKSYLYVSDCISAIMIAWKGQQSPYGIFNIGSKEKMTVDGIAQKLSARMGLDPKLLRGGASKGWPGDVPLMLLDTKKIEALGWNPQISFDDGFRRYLAWLDER